MAVFSTKTSKADEQVSAHQGHHNNGSVAGGEKGGGGPEGGLEEAEGGGGRGAEGGRCGEEGRRRLHARWTTATAGWQARSRQGTQTNSR